MTNSGSDTGRHAALRGPTGRSEPRLTALCDGWRTLVEERERQADRLRDGVVAPPPAADYWAGQAEAFDAAARRQPMEIDPLFQHLRPLVGGRRLLDVGAGTGRYAVPLSRVAAAVTAVEPSAGMRARLERRLAEAGASGVTVVPAAWPVEVPAHDVALVAHAIYGTRDIGGFLDGLEEAAALRIVVMRVEPMGATIAPVFAHLHGEPRLPDPTAATLLSILHARGQRPAVRTVPHQTGARFPDQAAALSWVADQCLLPAGDPRRRDLERLLSPLLTPVEGGLGWARPLRSAIISWGDAVTHTPEA